MQGNLIPPSVLELVLGYMKEGRKRGWIAQQTGLTTGQLAGIRGRYFNKPEHAASTVAARTTVTLAALEARVVTKPPVAVFRMTATVPPAPVTQDTKTRLAVAAAARRPDGTAGAPRTTLPAAPASRGSLAAIRAGAVRPARKCCWPTSDGRPWTFCDSPDVLAGKPYCAAHWRRAVG